MPTPRSSVLPLSEDKPTRHAQPPPAPPRFSLTAALMSFVTYPFSSSSGTPQNQEDSPSVYPNLCGLDYPATQSSRSAFPVTPSLESPPRRRDAVPRVPNAIFAYPRAPEDIERESMHRDTVNDQPTTPKASTRGKRPEREPLPSPPVTPVKKEEPATSIGPRPSSSSSASRLSHDASTSSGFSQQNIFQDDQLRNTRTTPSTSTRVSAPRLGHGPRNSSGLSEQNGQLLTPRTTPLKKTQVSASRTRHGPRTSSGLSEPNMFQSDQLFTPTTRVSKSTTPSVKPEDPTPLQHSGRLPQPHTHTRAEHHTDALADIQDGSNPTAKKTIIQRKTPAVDESCLEKRFGFKPHAWQDDIANEPPDFFHELPSKRPELLAWGPVTIFRNGQKLKYYQALDLQRMISRERHGLDCGTDVVNDIGLVLFHEMGLGKTVTAVALFVSNPAPKAFDGSPATLVICPNIGIMSHWRSEIEKFAPHLKVCFYDSSAAQLDLKADIVLVTYHQLKFQLRCFLDPETMHLAPLYHVCWWRLCADEIHTCRNPESKGAECLWSLQKRHALCLTGTPAQVASNILLTVASLLTKGYSQNSLLDLYVIFRFLDVRYEGVSDLQTFQRKIYAKGQKGPITSPRAQEILDTIWNDFFITRKRIDPETGKPLVKLPKRTDTTISVTLTHDERAIYDYTRNWTKSIFASIIRRRQACDHPLLLAKLLNTEPPHAEELDEDPVASQMKVESGESPILDVRMMPKKLRGLFKEDYMSSKLEVTRSILKTRLAGQKTIIFTHFTSLIPAIAEMLNKMKICWAEYTGGMSVMERDKSLTRIATDDNCTVIIVSIMAGGVGLNITSCDTVILLEPWWNPYAEEQAIARAHRIGQIRPVHVFRLIAADTIEESIVETQERKRETMGAMYGVSSPPDNVTLASWLAGT